MELIWEVLLELVLVGTLEISKNKKVPKIIRYPLIFLILLLFLGTTTLIFYTGILAYQKINKICGILLIIIAMIFLITSVIKLKRMYWIKMKGKEMK